MVPPAPLARDDQPQTSAPESGPVRPPPSRGLQPGLYAVSASLVHGLPWRVYDNARLPLYRWAPYDAGENAFSYFQPLKPIAQVGHSIFLYRVTAADAARLAPLWDADTRGPG